MQTLINNDAITARFNFLTDELSAGCDPDFDTAVDDLEREFQEIRLQICVNE